MPGKSAKQPSSAPSDEDAASSANVDEISALRAMDREARLRRLTTALDDLCGPLPSPLKKKAMRARESGRRKP